MWGSGKPWLMASFPCRLEDAAVDEVCSLVSGYCLDDGDDFLCGVEEACLGVLLLPARSITCASPLALFLCVLFHGRIIICIFADENPKVGGFPLPLVCQIQISNLILTFQILNEIASLIRSLGFRFPYSFQGFRVSLLSLIDNTKVRKSFDITKFIQDYLRPFRKVFAGRDCVVCNVVMI